MIIHTIELEMQILNSYHYFKNLLERIQQGLDKLMVKLSEFGSIQRTYFCSVQFGTTFNEISEL